MVLIYNEFFRANWGKIVLFLLKILTSIGHHLENHITDNNASHDRSQQNIAPLSLCICTDHMYSICCKYLCISLCLPIQKSPDICILKYSLPYRNYFPFIFPSQKSQDTKLIKKKICVQTDCIICELCFEIFKEAL